MREDEIFASGVKVEAFTQLFHRHDGAFQMPAWTARADCRIPRGFAWFGGFPDSEITGAIFVVLVYIDAGAIEHAAEIFFGEPAVLRKSGNAEIVRAIFSAVRDTFLCKLGDKVRHLGNVLSGADKNRLFDTDHGSVFQKCSLVFCGVLLDRNAVAGGIADDLVVYVGYVHDVA